MSNLRNINSQISNPSPLATTNSIVRLQSEEANRSPSFTSPLSIVTNSSASADKWSRDATSIEELKNLELVPLVLDIVEDINSGKLLPKDVDNSAGTIRVRINKAREILKNIHGLSELPEERQKRVDRLTKNIENKSRSLQSFKELVSTRIELDKDEKDVNMIDKDVFGNENSNSISDDHVKIKQEEDGDEIME
ncbi:hypothetical protein WICMUC_005151 [Wickerhamomyces mucosus]|uniref:Mediator of RNA polymerase II transcription subunit 9 n=1 Tax=Wickerhamomyces mucosus TaxID=1378264 RepID=A0A9P8P946_9ASCO|nr:hypothetical protein WICMUC_005151 [Wickerhamomyces mucosus]